MKGQRKERRKEGKEKEDYFLLVLVLIVTTSIFTVMLCMIGSIMSSTEAEYFHLHNAVMEYN